MIQTFLSYDDFLQFLNTSKRLFSELRKKVIYISLASYESFNYLTDENFREKILKKVENGWKQIHLKYDGACIIPFDAPMHQIEGYQPQIPNHSWKKCEIIKNCHFFNDIREFPFPMNHLKELSITNMKLLSTLTPLKDIPILSIFSCNNVNDFSMFSSQKSLTIGQCKGLTDVSNFHSIQKLSLIECKNLEDIRPLYGINDLTLNDLPLITDISCLGGHHRLTLQSFKKHVIGYEILQTIPHVTLISCEINDLRYLRNAKSVVLTNSIWERPPGVKPLRTVSEKVEITTSSKELIGVSELNEIPDLSLTLLDRECVDRIIQDPFIRKLKNKKLKLHLGERTPYYVEYNKRPKQISHLSIFPKTIQHLTLGGSYFVDYLDDGQASSLSHLQSLTLEEVCYLKSKFSGMKDIPMIKLVRMNDLKTLKSFQGCRYVEVVHCSDYLDFYELYEGIGRWKLIRED